MCHDSPNSTSLEDSTDAGCLDTPSAAFTASIVVQIEPPTPYITVTPLTRKCRSRSARLVQFSQDIRSGSVMRCGFIAVLSIVICAKSRSGRKQFL